MKKIHRFIIETDLKERVDLRDRALLHQWANVLKFKPEEEIELCDGKGEEAVYELISLEKKTAELKRRGVVRKNEAEPPRHVTLYAAVLKKENFDLIVQKTTECGVSEIVPIISDRIVKKNVKLDRLREIAKEAAEQSDRGRVPNVHEPLSFKAALAQAKMNEKNYFFHVGPNVEAFRDVKLVNSRIGLFIGPEGGWSDEEVKAAREAGLEFASLGPRVLRGETASVIATFLAN